MARTSAYSHSVFINCPFDARYRPLFRAIVFTVLDCGFRPRCALELTDSSLERLSKLFDIVSQCRFGIHDISRTGLDSVNRLPRFNMPLELGVFLGAKHFGNKTQETKNCIVLDRERYRFQKFISDIGGKDVYAHGNRVAGVIRVVRNWLGDFDQLLKPGMAAIQHKFNLFSQQLPRQCSRLSLEPRELTFIEYRLLMEEWLAKYEGAFPIR